MVTNLMLNAVKQRFIWFFTVLLAFSNISWASNNPDKVENSKNPTSVSKKYMIPKRELRGVWIATVANIDWPSRPGMSVEQQQNELLEILNNHQRAGMNAVFLQIRPAADAFYAKSNEPWSRFLTGSAGQAPKPFYDPLEFAIEEAHKRGMELHPWFNPYRATFDLNQNHVPADHITRTKPEWFFTYGGKKWFNPGIPEVRDYIIDVILNVVENYDIDGVHFDDYFYPYPDGKKPIPDAATFKKYGKDFKNIEDWRRNNVNLLVEELSIQIRNKKKHVRFGISPFGIWDNKSNHPLGSETSGFSGYRELYADAIKWTQEGWVDYVMPQLYFPFNYRAAAFEKLVDWWAKHSYGRHFYVGHASYRANENRDGWRDRSQIPSQIRFLRDQPSAHGSVFYSSKSIANNLVGLRDSMQYDLYKYKSLPPTMHWLDSIAPEAPENVRVEYLSNSSSVLIKWDPPKVAKDGDKAFGYVIYRFGPGEEVDIQNAQNILHISYNANETSYTDNLARKEGRFVYVVTALDRLKNESENYVPKLLTWEKISPPENNWALPDVSILQ